MTTRPDPADARRPPGGATLTPWLISADTESELEFLAAVFGAGEQPGSRVMNGASINHVEVDLAGSSVMLFDAPTAWQTPGHLRVYVHDLEQVVTDAVALGARVVTEPTSMPFGDRIARFRDPQGHLWWVHERVEDVSAEEMYSRFADPAYAEALAYAGRSLADHMNEWYGAPDQPAESSM